MPRGAARRRSASVSTGIQAPGDDKMTRRSDLWAATRRTRARGNLWLRKEVRVGAKAESGQSMFLTPGSKST